MATQARAKVPADIAKDMEAWKQAQAKIYQEQFQQLKLTAAANAEEAEGKRNKELAIMKTENTARSTQIALLKESVEQFQGKLLTDFGLLLEDRMKGVNDAQTAFVAEMREAQEKMKTAQELAERRAATLEANMQLLMAKLLGPEEAGAADCGPTQSPGSSPVTKKSKPVTIPENPLDHSPASTATAVRPAAEVKRKAKSKEGGPKAAAGSR